MKKPLVILLIVIVGLGICFLLLKYLGIIGPAGGGKALSLDPQKEATFLSKVDGTEGAYWMRGLPIVWNSVEKKQGEYDWTGVDVGITGGKDGYFSGEVYHVAIIWPYANWDQEACHQGEKYKATGHLKEAGEDLMMGAPCDMSAYARFLEKAVERYDGDGEDDMPGLTIPIKYWEIMNEPSMQGGSTGGMGEELKFFVGTSQEYLEILRTSYQTIKEADPEAKVLHAGMAGMQQNFRDFWEPVFSAGGGDYFDIANIHTISTDGKREDLYVIKFKRFLKRYGLEDRPIWITEIQYGSLMGKPDDLHSLEQFETLMVKSSVFALALGADKLFYIENWLHWNGKEGWEKEKGANTDTSTHKVYLNLVDKINSFDRVEKIKEEFVENQEDHDGATSKVGQYKFVFDSHAVYVLWGEAELPAEISGDIKVIDIYGKSRAMKAEDLILSDEPLFVDPYLLE